MPASTSEDLRACIVRWRDVYGWSVQDIALVANVSVRTVYRILALYRDYGLFRKHPTRTGAPRALDQLDLAYISALLRAQPTLYLDEIHERLWAVRDIDVSIATVSRTLARLAITNKRVSREAVERDLELRAIWESYIGKEDPNNMIWLDEAGADRQTLQRLNGWSTAGVGCVQRESFIRGVKYSVLPALTLQGVIALEVIEGAVDADRFLRFLQERVVSPASE